MDDDDFNEYIDLPHQAPKVPTDVGEGRAEIGIGIDGAGDEAIQPDGSRSVTDRRGRTWQVSELQSPGSGGEPSGEVMLRFVHFGIVLRADGAPARWRELPSAKLLSLAGLD